MPNNDAENALAEIAGYAHIENNRGATCSPVTEGRLSPEEIRQQIQEVINGPLAAQAATDLKNTLDRLRIARAATPDEKRYIDLLFGILDRAGFSPHRPKDDDARDPARMNADELTALRRQINDVLSARAKNVDAQDGAQEPPDIDVKAMGLFD